MKKVNPISTEKFNKVINSKKNKAFSEQDFISYFFPNIEKVADLAIGQYFWFIGSRKDSKIIAVSKNIHQLTPFSEKEWTNGDAYFFANLFHPEDKNHVLSAFIFALELAEKLPFEKQKNCRVNIYGRMLDANEEFQWRLIQFPGYYFDENGIVESSWIMVTDISHLHIDNQAMITFFDGSNIENQYFKVMKDQTLKPLPIPKISKREHEILLLTSKGLNSPEVAEKLSISYHTVENHKRNLRIKTNTKTSAELISFAFKNNIF
jgi:DNA-binding CsgD family transcriptional regulator